MTDTLGSLGLTGQLLISCLGVAALVLRRRGLRSPLTLFLAIWLTLSLAMSIPDLVSPPLTARAWGYVMLSTIGAIGGSLVSELIAGNGAPVRRNVTRPLLSPSRLVRLHCLALAGLTLYGIVQLQQAWPLVQQAGGVGAVFNFGDSAAQSLRRSLTADRLTALEGGLSTFGAIAGLLNYVLFMGNVSLFTGALLMRRGHRVLAALPLVVAALYSLLTLQRSTFVNSLLLFLFVLSATPGDLKRPTSHASPPRQALRLLGAAGSAMVILLPVQLRNSGTGDPTGLSSLRDYFLSGIAGLAYRTQEDPLWINRIDPQTGVQGPDPGHGAYSFSGFVNIIRRLGVDVPTVSQNFPYFPIDIADRISYLNTESWLAYFVLDFGPIGALVGPFAVILLGGIYQRRVDRHHLASLGPYAVIMTTIALSFFTFMPRDVRYILLALVGSWVLARITAPESPASSVTLTSRRASGTDEHDDEHQREQAFTHQTADNPTPPTQRRD